MKSKNLSELSIAELTAKEKTLKIVTGAFMGIMSVFGVMLVLLFVQKQLTIAIPLVAVFFSLMAVLFVNKKELTNIKTELEARNINNNNMI
jgi:cobalamin biosynthesis protein CobD/CbiB